MCVKLLKLLKISSSSFLFPQICRPFRFLVMVTLIIVHLSTFVYIHFATEEAMRKTEVVKHSAAIQISNRITLLQRRAWNVLLAEAFDQLLSEEIHRLPVKRITEYLQYDSKNEQHLKDALTELMSTTVIWNMLLKDRNKKTWIASTLLAGAQIENGILEYSFSPQLKQQLYNPAMYARISLSIQNRFVSKHALAVYELCVDYFDISRGRGETPWIEIDKYRRLMGLNDDEYSAFKHLNTRVIKEPVKEINDKSNLWIDIEYRKEKRSVVAIKFLIKPNPNKENAIQQIEAKHPALPAPEDIKHPAVYKRLIAYFGFNESDARRAIDEYEPGYIAGNLDEVESRIKKGKKIGDLRAYTFKALKEDYRQQPSLFDTQSPAKSVDIVTLVLDGNKSIRLSVDDNFLNKLTRYQEKQTEHDLFGQAADQLRSKGYQDAHISRILNLENV